MGGPQGRTKTNIPVRGTGVFLTESVRIDEAWRGGWMRIENAWSQDSWARTLVAALVAMVGGGNGGRDAYSSLPAAQ